MDLKLARNQFSTQRWNAKSRGIAWKLTFDEWCEIWRASGKWHLRGCRRGQYVMHRINDDGPYAVGNVIIVPAGTNVAIWTRDAEFKQLMSRSVSHAMTTWWASRSKADRLKALRKLAQARKQTKTRT